MRKRTAASPTTIKTFEQCPPPQCQPYYTIRLRMKGTRTRTSADSSTPKRLPLHESCAMLSSSSPAQVPPKMQTRDHTYRTHGVRTIPRRGLGAIVPHYQKSAVRRKNQKIAIKRFTKWKSIHRHSDSSPNSMLHCKQFSIQSSP
jgi:hypothetical protein